ncbi:hypothetical protein HWN40_13175 [Methanolobus zinderi]|uniref:Uncharacterized protein n=1 Tax=Methanolobus zinderi TaxID=536044 RepID=A0A7D5I6G3_9EURY|nr:hypothetical protein [Methanolobus zinderi]QLC51101.1 hypothetical protein HWN40_13175 [Methanolobus zinderi]
MAKAKYRLKDNNGSGIYVTIPSELAFALGLRDLNGNIITGCVRFELGYDDTGPYGIIRPAIDQE